MGAVTVDAAMLGVTQIEAVSGGRDEGVLRVALLDRLSECLNRRLTLISAPAGAGKTTLLRQWAARCSCRTVWVSLSSAENDPAAFWNAVVEAVGGGLSLRTADPGSTLGSSSDEELTARLLTVSGMLSGESVLLFDNFQVITSSAIHGALAAFLDRLPAHLHVVLGTRADPALPVSRLRSQGHLGEIRGPQLRLSFAESRAMLNECQRLGLTHRDVEQLHTRMEGWAAGLRLAAVALSETDDVSGTVAALGGEHPFVADYFADEVLTGLPEEMRSFLLHTSIVSSFCASLCEALTGQGHSMLRRLRQLNLFLVPLDERGRWYRYHHCFAEMLARELEEQGADEVRRLHLAAMRWYMQRDMMRDVVHHALAAGEFYVAADAIERQVDELIWERGEIAGLLKWLAALPGEVMRSRPRLCMAHAWALALTGQLDALEDHLSIAEQSLLPLALTGVSIPSLPVQQASTRLDPTVLGELAAVRAVAAGSQFDTIRLETSSSEAISHDPENHFLRSVLALSRARAYDIAANIPDAITAYGEARYLSESIGNAHVQVVASSRLAELWAVKGELHQSADAHRSVLRIAGDAPERRSAMGAMSHVGLGSVLYEWNDVSGAAVHFEEGMRQAERWGHLETLKGAYFGLARVRFAQHVASEAFELLDQAEVLARHSNAPRSIVWVRAMQARLNLAQGNVAAAMHWHETAELRPDRYPPRLYTGEYTTLIRLLTAQGRYDEAVPILEALFGIAMREHWMGLTVELLLLHALLLHARGTFRAAVPQLRKALSLASPEGYLRTFLDEGPALAVVLERAASQVAMPSYVDVVLGAFRAGAPALPGRLASAGTLTLREREVLRHIAAGESNHEIAGHLVLSLATVKRHVSNIFSKLDVSSRTQAVARAHELGLI